ncbi:hypothetical protein [Pseudolactococcus insecticola]|uniref:Uncharacterized protein n=1 Tax=Pseudolactococcus insecticola TaxID=2709158 RepID=A0A6A0B750_9LACT|nr:hypothetical protein [Lactococcus insecticola]GFH40134.1 hypothetical protein Hs20B_05320 [Lactococcus insecticola]
MIYVNHELVRTIDVASDKSAQKRLKITENKVKTDQLSFVYELNLESPTKKWTEKFTEESIKIAPASLGKCCFYTYFLPEMSLTSWSSFAWY